LLPVPSATTTGGGSALGPPLSPLSAQRASTKPASTVCSCACGLPVLGSAANSAHTAAAAAAAAADVLASLPPLIVASAAPPCGGGASPIIDLAARAARASHKRLRDGGSAVGGGGAALQFLPFSRRIGRSQAVLLRSEAEIKSSQKWRPSQTA
jgi:hypothetical protein